MHVYLLSVDIYCTHFSLFCFPNFIHYKIFHLNIHQLCKNIFCPIKMNHFGLISSVVCKVLCSKFLLKTIALAHSKEDHNQRFWQRISYVCTRTAPCHLRKTFLLAKICFFICTDITLSQTSPAFYVSALQVF